MTFSELGKIMLERTRRIGQAWAVLSYYTVIYLLYTKYIQICICTSGFGAVRWCLTLSSFRERISIRRLDVHCTAAREVSSAAAASGSRQQRWGVCSVRHNFLNYLRYGGYGAETKERFYANLNMKYSRRIQHTPTSKSKFLFVETPYMDLRARPTRKVIHRTSRFCNPQNTRAPPRRDRGCQNTCLDIPLVYVHCSGLPRKQRRLTLSKLEKKCEVRKHEDGWDRLEPM